MFVFRSPRRTSAVLFAGLVVSLMSLVYLGVNEMTPNQNIRSIRGSKQPSYKKIYNDEFYEGLDDRIDKMEAQELPVLPNYKTPCWFENLTVADPYPVTSHVYIRFFSKHHLQGSFRNMFKKNVAMFKQRLQNGTDRWRLRCLPSFYLIGANRGGSTALWSSLVSHVNISQGGVAKELHYWNEIRYGGGLEKMGFGNFLALIRNDTIPRPLKSYVDLFDSAAEKIRTTYVKGPDGKKFHPTMLGEGSPNYLNDFGNWDMLPANRGLSEPKYTIAHIIKMLTPRVKIVATLRNPTERSISEYIVYMKHSKKTPEDFHQLVTRAINLMKLCLTNRTLRSCAYDLNMAAKTQPVILQHSLYYPFVKDWMDVFTPKQTIIVRSEDFYANHTKVANEIFRFLELDVMKKVRLGGRNARFLSRKQFAPYNKTVDMLREFYKPYNKQLAEYLGSKKFLWTDEK